MVKPLLLKGLSDYIGWFIDPIISECLRATHWSFCFSKSMSIANTLSMLLTLPLLNIAFRL